MLKNCLKELLRLHGIEEVTNAVNLGAVNKLVILDTDIKVKDSQSLMDMVETVLVKLL